MSLKPSYEEMHAALTDPNLTNVAACPPGTFFSEAIRALTQIVALQADRIAVITASWYCPAAVALAFRNFSWR